MVGGWYLGVDESILPFENWNLTENCRDQQCYFILARKRITSVITMMYISIVFDVISATVFTIF